ncbi:MAG: glucosamine-6-phosphate deaminase [Bryobacteraceae bacterium]|nr:glucosamine-6-phosphate deaminase [Bryobacteraceae bacterium]
MRVHIYPNREELGRAAAEHVAACLRRLIQERGRAVAVFASAPSQIETLRELVHQPGIDWRRVTAFHLDEYTGLAEDHRQSFRRFLREHLTSRVPLAAFHDLRGDASDPAAECARYASLLNANPPDIALVGIGENGHLAFNDPPVADFHDPLDVKLVELDEICRRQQVHDGLFARIEEVPRFALTLTLPAILRIPRIFAVVPGIRKREAVTAALLGPVSTECPASILRTHPDADLFLDRDSAPPGWPDQPQV